MSAARQAEFGTCHECWALHSGYGMVCDACRARSQQCHCSVCRPSPVCACGDCTGCSVRALEARIGHLYGAGPHGVSASD